ncbi:MAG: archaeal proteasome endopeptidase complex subunit alpha [Desulfurococcales archaeon]|nr:archaeal proteasome endopeptidase complex subunit alpha [Desulfurococcales archaeon]
MSFGPPAMGYDRAITIFSPDGRIYQVEYAFEAVRRGWTTIGIKSRSGAAVVVEKRRISPLIDHNAIQKIFIIDEHIGVSFAGIASDGRVLIDYARLAAIRHRFLYDEPITVEYLAKQICDVKQAYTQHAGVRPFGVAMILVGVDFKGPQLYMTEPSGRYMSYYAAALGEKSQAVTEFLERNYKYDLTMKETLKLGIEALSKALEGKMEASNLEIGYVDVEEKKFKILTLQEIAELLQ